MSISWNTGLAAERARHNLKLKKERIKRFDKALDNFVKQIKAPSPKRQAKKDLDSHKIPDIK